MSLRLFNDAEVQDFVVLLVDEVGEVLHHIVLLVVRGTGQLNDLGFGRRQDRHRLLGVMWKSEKVSFPELTKVFQQCPLNGGRFGMLPMRDIFSTVSLRRSMASLRRK